MVLPHHSLHCPVPKTKTNSQNKKPTQHPQQLKPAVFFFNLILSYLIEHMTYLKNQHFGQVY